MPIQKGPANLGTGSVDSTELASTLDLSAKTVTYRTIVAGDIASNAITTAKLATDLVVTHALGSAGTPSITTTGDTDTGVWFPAANTLAASTGGSERVRIDSSGNVGIGVTAPLDKLSISTSTAGGVGGVISAANGATATVGNESVLAFRSASQFGTTYYSGKIRSVMTNASTFVCDLAFNTYDSSGANGVEVMRITSAGLFQFNSGYGSVATAYGCRAWVNFNGTGTVAINASGNVSSITDNGTGDYTVNFTTALSDANYAVASFGTRESSGNNTRIATFTDGSTKSTSAFNFSMITAGSTAKVDVVQCNLSVYR